jgi:glucokinase
VVAQVAVELGSQGVNIVDMALYPAPDNASGVIALWIAGDGPAREVVAQAGRHIGVALSSLANIFEPDLFVLGGGVMRAGELLLEPARQELRVRALPPQNETRVVAAQLGPEAGMIGAATMALEEVGG